MTPKTQTEKKVENQEKKGANKKPVNVFLENNTEQLKTRKERQKSKEANETDKPQKIQWILSSWTDRQTDKQRLTYRQTEMTVYCTHHLAAK